MFLTGLMYANGEGVKKNFNEAVYWYRKAASQGDALAQNNLGVLYQNGHGVDKDNEGAKKWYLKAAENGNVTARRNPPAFHPKNRTDRGSRYASKPLLNRI